MFTGLVETTGTLETPARTGGDARLRVQAPFAQELSRGESVSVDGVCLTAVERGDDWFEAVLSPETLSRTTLGLRRPGDRVNLERALPLGGRLGGHLVQGHVDGVGVIESVRRSGDGTVVTIRFPDILEEFIVLKGSIAVDGVSLTVAAREPRRFEVALIPETLQRTGLGAASAGTPVNLEVDMMGRYVVEYLRARHQAGDSTVTREHLVRHGFTGKEDAP